MTYIDRSYHLAPDIGIVINEDFLSAMRAGVVSGSGEPSSATIESAADVGRVESPVGRARMRGALHAQHGLSTGLIDGLGINHIMSEGRLILSNIWAIIMPQLWLTYQEIAEEFGNQAQTIGDDSASGLIRKKSRDGHTRVLMPEMVMQEYFEKAARRRALAKFLPESRERNTDAR